MKHIKLFLPSFSFLMCLFLCLFSFFVDADRKEQPIVVITPSYHNAPFYKRNLDSIFNQNYSNYRVIYIADGDFLPDSDGTGTLVERYVKEKGQEHRFTLIRNKDRHFALNNTYRAILNCRDDEIFIVLDGDDALNNPNVLSRVNAMYNQSDKEVWYTYGDFRAIHNTMTSWTSAIPESALAENKLREWQHSATHLRTCRAWLAKQIKIEDFFYNGYFFTVTGDVALFEPIMEMANRRYHMTREVLYDYNDVHALCDHIVAKQKQMDANAYIRQKERYQKLDRDMSGRIDKLKKEGALVADVIVFSDNNAARLGEFLRQLAQVENLKTVSVIYKTPELCNEAYDNLIYQFPTCKFFKQADSAQNFKQQLVSIFGMSPSAYVIFARDENICDDTIDVETGLYWLELTHVHAFYFNLTKPFFDTLSAKTNRKPAQLNLTGINGHDIFAWQYSLVLAPFTELLNMTLLRKTDLLSLVALQAVDGYQALERAWQQSLNENQVGLFCRIAEQVNT